MSNTSQVADDNQAPEAGEITDQDTLDAALAELEPAEAEEVVVEDETTEDQVNTDEGLEKKPEPQKFMGKYNSQSDFENAFKSLQAEYTQTSQKLKEYEKRMKEKELEDVKSLDYDQQMSVLLNRIQELEAQQQGQLSQFDQLSQAAAMESDQQQLEEFIKKTPELVETGMDDLFRTIAQHPDMQQYTFDSIYTAKFKPKLDKLMGTRIKVKERPLKGSSKAPEQPKDLQAMSLKEYEKNREQILKDAGIKF